MKVYILWKTHIKGSVMLGIYQTEELANQAYKNKVDQWVKIYWDRSSQENPFWVADHIVETLEEEQ